MKTPIYDELAHKYWYSEWAFEDGLRCVDEENGWTYYTYSPLYGEGRRPWSEAWDDLIHALCGDDEECGQWYSGDMVIYA